MNSLRNIRKTMMSMITTQNHSHQGNRNHCAFTSAIRFHLHFGLTYLIEKPSDLLL